MAVWGYRRFLISKELLPGRALFLPVYNAKFKPCYPSIGRRKAHATPVLGTTSLDHRLIVNEFMVGANTNTNTKYICDTGQTRRRASQVQYRR
jgi:hypothetical protein